MERQIKEELAGKECCKATNVFFFFSSAGMPLLSETSVGQKKRNVKENEPSKAQSLWCFDVLNHFVFIVIDYELY